jgi:ankyrin repeat protein
MTETDSRGDRNRSVPLRGRKRKTVTEVNPIKSQTTSLHKNNASDDENVLHQPDPTKSGENELLLRLVQSRETLKVSKLLAEWQFSETTATSPLSIPWSLRSSTLKNKSLIHICVANHDEETLKVLLCNNFIRSQLLNLPDDRGITPLHLCLCFKSKWHPKVARLLLDANADLLILPKGKHVSELLHCAIRFCNDDEIFSMVLQMLPKSVFTHHDSNGWGPLHLAAHYGEVQKLKLLLKEGAHPNDPGTFNWPPLHIAGTLFSIINILIFMVS